MLLLYLFFYNLLNLLLSEDNEESTGRGSGGGRVTGRTKHKLGVEPNPNTV